MGADSAAAKRPRTAFRPDLDSLAELAGWQGVLVEQRTGSRSPQVRRKEAWHLRAKFLMGKPKFWRCAGSPLCGSEKPRQALRTVANSPEETQPSAHCPPPVRQQVPPGRLSARAAWEWGFGAPSVCGALGSPNAQHFCRPRLCCEFCPSVRTPGAR